MVISQRPAPSAIETTKDARRDLVGWDPNNAHTWNSKIAWTTLWVTTFNLMLAFIIWYLPGALIPTLGTITGWNLTESQSYWLLAMPGLTGGALRLVWMTLPPLIGTRPMMILSSALMIIPFVGWTWVVTLPTQPPYGLLLALALAAGIGGGVFSGYMPSTSYFFPKAKQGIALGLQAGIGNFGVSVVQFVVPWAIGFSMFGIAGQVSKTEVGESFVWLQNPGLIFIPFALVGCALTWTTLKSVPMKANLKQQFDIFNNKHTWLMTMQYVLTFGIFSGLAGTFGMLLKQQFGPEYLKWVFLGALVGSLVRMSWGPLCDKFGGAIWTFVAGIGMALSAGIVLFGQLSTRDKEPNLEIFMVGMLLIFFFAGIGNASTFKQMPMIFSARQAGGVIGWTAAIAAFGPFIFSVAFNYFSRVQVFSFIIVYAVACAVVSWHFYARPRAEAKS
ncbi:MFS transporter [Timonella sp. A28]|uniref:MFS transporter n=1 Tax=Timonella sp. A28 TaxID=3442640 RepID=UPI003EBCE695